MPRQNCGYLASQRAKIEKELGWTNDQLECVSLFLGIESYFFELRTRLLGSMACDQ